jgi:hypothetical protein
MFHRSRLISIAASVAMLLSGAATAAIVTADQANAKTVKAKTVARSAPARNGSGGASAPARSTYQSY